MMMGKKVSGLLLLFGFSLAIVSPSSPVMVQANTFRQDTAPFSGYQVYFTESNREASPYDHSKEGVSFFAGLLHRLGAEIRTLNLRDNVPDDADVVVIAGPTRDLTFDQSALLWLYLNKGGRLLLIADPLVIGESAGRVTTETNRALPARRGLFELTWETFGLRAYDAVVARPGELHPVQPTSPPTEAGQPTSTPAAPFLAPMLVIDFTTTAVSDQHPITSGFAGVLTFSGVRPLEFDQQRRPPKAIPLIFSTPDFYGETAYADYLLNGTEQFTPVTDVPQGQLPVAAAAEDEETSARLVLIGDREFATNGGGLQTSPANSISFVYPANVRFLLNSVAWLMGVDPATLAVTPFPTPAATATMTPSFTPSATSTSTPTLTSTPTGTPTRGCMCDLVLTNTAIPTTAP